MSRYQTSRRSFLTAVGGAAIWASFVSKLEAQDQGAAPPKRLLVIQRPVGTVTDNWTPIGTGRDYKPSRILAPFTPLRSQMAVLNDIKLPSEGSVGGGHERGTVLLLTGARTKSLYPGNGGDDPKAEGPSIDQLFVRQSTMLQGTPIASLQLSCDSRADTPEVSTRHLSYSGPSSPMKPYYQPAEVYDRLFGPLASGVSEETLRRAREEKKSVLDFSRRDLLRLRALAPSSQRESLDALENAIRELERELDGSALGPVACGVAMKPPPLSTSGTVGGYGGDHVSKQRDDQIHEQIAKLHFSLIKAAFRCDLTRVITFQFSPGTNHVSFGDLWPPNPALYKVHHTTSHDPDSPDTLEFLTRVEIWYAERVSAFLQELSQEKHSDGSSLLDHTLVPYVTEVATRHHNFNNMPFAIFGGKGTGLVGGQVWTNNKRGLRSSNDLWMACAKRFGLDGFTLGDSDMHTTALEGLFA